MVVDLPRPWCTNALVGPSVIPASQRTATAARVIPRLSAIAAYQASTAGPNTQQTTPNPTASTGCPSLRAQLPRIRGADPSSTGATLLHLLPDAVALVPDECFTGRPGSRPGRSAEGEHRTSRTVHPGGEQRPWARNRLAATCLRTPGNPAR